MSKKPYSRKMWTEDEVKVLKAMCRYFSARMIADRLGRGESGVKAKIASLGISLRARGRIAKPSRREWSEQEIKILRSSVGKLSALEMKKLLPKRTDRAIRLKASSLGLSLFKTPWSSEDLDKLLELRDSGKAYPEISSLLNRTAGACRAKYNYLTKY
jgi:hypothetical protein